MEITTSEMQGRVPVTVFHIKGDIDTDSYEQLQTAANQAIQQGKRYLVLDLKEVPYVSSYGVRAISQIFNWLRSAADGETSDAISKGVRDGSFKSHHLKVANASPRVLKVLSETGLDMFMEIDTDLNKAVSSF